MPCHSMPAFPASHFLSNIVFSLRSPLHLSLSTHPRLPSLTPTISIVYLEVARARFDCSVACPNHQVLSHNILHIPRRLRTPLNRRHCCCFPCSLRLRLQRHQLAPQHY